jgi:hypothetical protein
MIDVANARMMAAVWVVQRLNDVRSLDGTPSHSLL